MAKEEELKFSLEVGDHFLFKGYSFDNPTPILTEGEMVKILALGGEDESYAVESVLTKVKDTLFYPEEIETASDDDEVNEAYAARPDDAANAGPADAEEAAEEAEEAEEAVEEAPKAAAKPVAKAAAKPAAKPAAKAEAKATTKPAAKAKGKLAASAKAKGKAASAKAAQVPIEIIDIEAVREVIEEAGDALAAAPTLIERAERSYYVLGGVLLHIEREGLFKTLGYDGKTGFNDYVSNELNVQYRMSRQLMQMYQHFTELGISEEQLSVVGWTKARELVQIKTKAQIEAALEFATEHTRDELITHVRSQYVPADASAGRKAGTETGDKVKRTTFKFSAIEEDAELVETAINSAKEKIGTESFDEAMRYIITEWAQTEGGVDVSLEQALSAVEGRFGVQLAIVEEEPQGAEEAEAEAAA